MSKCLYTKQFIVTQAPLKVRTVAPKKPAFVNDRNLAILTVILWIFPFLVYLFNTPEPSILNMSKPFAYSVIWWIIVLILFTIWAIFDLRGGE